MKPGTAVVAQEQREMEREVQELLKSMLKQQQQEVGAPPSLSLNCTHTTHTHTKGSVADKIFTGCEIGVVEVH